MQTTPRTTPPPLAPVIDPNVPEWPKILGIFAITIGGIAFLAGLMRLWGGFVYKAQLNNIAKNGLVDAEVVNEYLAEAIPLQVYSGILLAVVALLLLSGGIMLLKRRRISSVLIRVWAIAYLVVGIGITYKSFLLVSQQVSIAMAPAIAENQNGEAAMVLARRGAEIATKAGLVISLVWVLTTTIFALIWFGRRKIRDEVKEWD